MNNVNTLCITTVVNEMYQEFIPWFVYFIKESYPEYYISIFLIGKANKKVRRCLDLIGGNFCLHENCYSGYPANVLITKCLRWTNYSDEFEKFDYIYTGDIDMLICKEEPSLLQQHIQHCDFIGLPYSNQIRGFGDWKNKPRRLTGLHFVKRNEWYTAMRNIMIKYDRLLQKNCVTYGQNEVMLYQMVKESSLKLPKEIDEISDSEYRFRPHHGLHLGLWRSPNTDQKLKTFFPRTKAGWKNCVSPIHVQYLSQFKKMQQDVIYTQLYKLLVMPRLIIDRMVQFYTIRGILI